MGRKQKSAVDKAVILLVLLVLAFYLVQNFAPAKGQNTVGLTVRVNYKDGSSKLVSGTDRMLSVVDTEGKSISSIVVSATLYVEFTGNVSEATIQGQLQTRFDGDVKRGTPFSIPQVIVSGQTYNLAVETTLETDINSWATSGTHTLAYTVPSGAVLTLKFTDGNVASKTFSEVSASLTLTVQPSSGITVAEITISPSTSGNATPTPASPTPSSTPTPSGAVVANSGSPQDIQAAVNTAAAAGGGTVYIPEGDFTFNPSGIIGPANTPTGVISYGGINIIGAGIGKTILRETKDPPLINGYGTSMIAVDGRNNKPFRISGISFVGFVSSEDYGNTALELDSCLDYRVDHCEFDSFSGLCVVAQNIGGHNRGLVDHCVFSASYKLKSPPAGTEWQWGYGIMVWDKDYTAWSDIGTLLGKYEGADDIIYVEDCTFKQLRHAITNSQNGYYVIRHCTIENAIPPNFGQIDVHGFNCGRGCEAYDNTVIATSGYPAAQAVWLRGGTGTIFNNTFVNHAYGVMLFRETVAVPPYTHQNPVTDTYIWNNIMQGGGIAFSDQDAYTENADYFLYARPNYTPYPYPHPLTLR